MSIWLQLPEMGYRRRDWLLGRIAAKDAIRLFLKTSLGLDALPMDIEIAPGEHGRPIVMGQFVESLGCSISLSISHSGGAAVAIAGARANHWGVGVDLERLNGSLTRVERVAFNADERVLLSMTPPSKRPEWLLRFWCGKEAVAKSLGVGMVGGPTNLTVENFQVRTGRLDVTLAGELASRLPAFKDVVLTAYTGREGVYVFASSLVRAVL
jgi:phosphopantetheinyl transferase